MKKVKGITLIALVITIIVLLILAGVSIATLIGGGILNKAQLAKTRTGQARTRRANKASHYGSKNGKRLSCD